MRYTLLWSPALAVFTLTDPTGRVVARTETELRASFGGDATLNQWADFTQANPNRPVDYNMLPS